MARSEIDRQILALYEEKERQRLEAGRLAGHRAEDHQPVFVPDRAGEIRRIGCSCSWLPQRNPTRVSMMHVPFMRHLHSLGLPPMDRLMVRYSYGPAKGLTWDEARARGIEPEAGVAPLPATSAGHRGLGVS